MNKTIHDTISVNVNGAENFIVFEVPSGSSDFEIGVGIESANMVIGGEDAEPILDGSNNVSVFRNEEEIASFKRGHGSYFAATSTA